MLILALEQKNESMQISLLGDVLVIYRGEYLYCIKMQNYMGRKEIDG